MENEADKHLSDGERLDRFGYLLSPSQIVAMLDRKCSPRTLLAAYRILHERYRDSPEQADGPLIEDAGPKKMSATPKHSTEDTLRQYVNWYVEAKNYAPSCVRDVANFLDEERNNGQFADNDTVQWLYGLIGNRDVESMISRLSNE